MMKYSFSGHESFPCKTLWLKKGYEFITNGGDFNAAEAVVRLGVGKNMVTSIRYWFKAFGFNNEKTEWIAKYIFDSEEGKDPFTEDIGTLWLLHFLLIYAEEASLYNLFFVDFQKERREFDRAHVVSFVKRKMTEAGKDGLFNENTVKKDVGVLLLNYCLPQNPQSNEDFSTLLMDLDLLRPMGKKWSDGEGRDRYIFNIEGKREVVPEVFLFAILMKKEEADNSISFDMMQELGLIFCMNDLEVINMLKLLSDKYSDSLLYSDVAGVRQLQFTKKLEAKQVLNRYYE